MKVGMVLEGGALRTIFSTGVLDAMLEKDLMTDYVVGVSAGIAYGVSYVSRQPRRNLEILTRFANDRRYMGLGNLLDRHNRSYFGLEFSYETIPNELVPFDYDTFAAFPGKVEAGVTNLETGKAEYLEVPRRDDSFLLLQATCAMPLMFPVYRLGGKPYLDGGAAETVPYPRAFEMGCDRAIVILTKPRSFVRKREKLLPVIERRYREYPNFCQTMRERAERDNRAREELFRLEKEGKVLVLAPEDLRGVSRIEREWRSCACCGRTDTSRGWSGWRRSAPSWAGRGSVLPPLRRVQGVQGQQISQNGEKSGQAAQFLLGQPPGQGCGHSGGGRSGGVAPGPAMKARQTDHPRTMLCSRPPGRSLFSLCRRSAHFQPSHLPGSVVQ